MRFIPGDPRTSSMSNCGLRLPFLGVLGILRREGEAVQLLVGSERDRWWVVVGDRVDLDFGPERGHTVDLSDAIDSEEFAFELKRD